MTPEEEYHWRTHTLRGYLATYRDGMRDKHMTRTQVVFGWTAGLAVALTMYWTDGGRP